MASKQLGKFRQWAGEVISSREKSQPSSELLVLEQDMELRKRGIDRLHIASSDYMNYISLTTHSEALPKEDKILHSEALGVVMIGYGEELGSESAYARSLSLYGRARCRIAALQNIFAVTFTDTFLTSLDHSRAELDAYLEQRKKLESRRLTYDAALTKLDKIKASISKKEKEKEREKKEKERKEAEEEVEVAKARYEEIAEDMHARMNAIKEDEVKSQKELQNLLELEHKYVEQYLEALKEVKDEWPTPDCYADLRKGRPMSAAFHDFSRTSTRSSDSKSSIPISSETHGTRKAPPVPTRFSSHRSTHSTQSHISRHSIESSSLTHEETNNEHKQSETTLPNEDEPISTRPLSRALSLSRRNSTKSSKSVKSTKSGSRPSSRLSKKSKGHRRNSTSSVITSNSEDGRTEIDEDDEERGKHRKSGSIANWVGGVGGAVAVVMGGKENGKAHNTDVENFAVLGDGDDSKAVLSDDDEEVANGEKNRKKSARRLSSRSNRSTKSSKSVDGGRSISGFFGFGSKANSKTNNVEDDGGSKGVKIMRALRDYSGKVDELSFRVGDEIHVQNEVLEDWWLGECNGQKGLFPVSYTTQIVGHSSTPKVINGGQSDSGRTSGHTTPKKVKSKEKLKRNSFSSRSNSSILLSLGSHSRRGSTSRIEVEELESRRQLVASESEFTSESEASHENSDDEHEHHLWHNRSTPNGKEGVNGLHSFENGSQSQNTANEFKAYLSQTLTKLDAQQSSSNLSGAGSPVKRAPPPPPPRRLTSGSTAGGGGPPPLPTRNAAPIPSRVHSTVSIPSSLNPALIDDPQVRKTHSAGGSPFESQSEISLNGNTSVKCSSCGCNDFIEDPFRGHGLCANCTHEHI